MQIGKTTLLWAYHAGQRPSSGFSIILFLFFLFLSEGTTFPSQVYVSHTHYESSLGQLPISLE